MCVLRKYSAMDRKFGTNQDSCQGCQQLKSQLAEFKNSMEIQLATMESANTAMNATIVEHLEAIRKHFVAPKIEFPCKTKEDLQDLENKVAESPENYIEAFRQMVGLEGLEKNLERFFTRELIMTMNYAGGPGKIGLKSYCHLNNCLFKASRTKGRNFGDYIRTVREAFGKAKQRVYKAKSKAKKFKPDPLMQE